MLDYYLTSSSQTELHSNDTENESLLWNNSQDLLVRVCSETLKQSLLMMGAISSKKEDLIDRTENNLSYLLSIQDLIINTESENIFSILTDEMIQENKVDFSFMSLSTQEAYKTLNIITDYSVDALFPVFLEDPVILKKTIDLYTIIPDSIYYTSKVNSYITDYTSTGEPLYLEDYDYSKETINLDKHMDELECFLCLYEKSEYIERVYEVHNTFNSSFIREVEDIQLDLDILH